MISLRVLKRLIVIVFGITVLLIGVVLLVLPGPGSLVIIAGLAILAGEFVWARWALRKVKSGVRRMNHMIRGASAQEGPPEEKPAGSADNPSGKIAGRKPDILL